MVRQRSAAVHSRSTTTKRRKSVIPTMLRPLLLSRPSSTLRTLGLRERSPALFLSVRPPKQGRQFSSILDKFSEKMAERRENKSGKLFREQIRKVSEAERFDMTSFEDQLSEGLNSWALKIPLLNSSKEATELKSLKAILAAMTPEEKAHPGRIGPQERQRIATTAQTTVDEVDGVMHKFEQSEVLYRWLKERRRRGQRVPRSEAQMNDMMTDNRQLSLRAFVQPKPSAAGGRRVSSMHAMLRQGQRPRNR